MCACVCTRVCVCTLCVFYLCISSPLMILLAETITAFVFAAQSETNIEAEVSLDVSVVV